MITNVLLMGKSAIPLNSESVDFEAWERMTYGGVRVYYETGLNYHPALFLEMGRTHWVPLASR